MESCFTDAQTYATCGNTDVAAGGVTTGTSKGQVNVTGASATGYTITATSKGKNGVVYTLKSTAGSTERTCAPAGQEPPAGYVRYPDGQVPRHVGDKWDKYWQTHVIDRSGVVSET